MAVSRKKTAAKKAPAKKKSVAVAKPATTALAPTNWRERAKQSLATNKQALSKLPQASGNFLSFRNGDISLGGVKLENPLPVIVLAYGYERTYYSRPYQPDVLSAPDCYSFDGETPHEDAAVPQNDICRTCRFDAFGSAQNGKGKGCKEGARLVLLHGDTTESAEGILKGQIVQARLSVLNSKTFRAYAEAVEARDMPLWADISLLENQPDPKSQYATSFQLTGTTLPNEVLDAIAARVDEAEKLLIQPYPELEEAPQAPAKRGGRARKF